MRGPWHLTPQAAQAAVNIFQSLGLREAHYKPTPVLPPTQKAANLGAADFGSDGGSAIGYQVAGGKNSIHLPHQHYNESDWGQPSYLLLPKDTGSSYKSSATVGPGSCSVINSSYTPLGGWSSLPGNDSFDAFDDTKATIFRYRKPVGVNLGSWFVSESWMAPSLFGCATGNASAELDILEGFGSSASGVSNASAFMNHHWDTWVREEDFQKMAGLGINTVRIPIGYWTLGGNWTDNTPFAPWADVYANSWRYLVRGIRWAAKYNIGILVDLHGAYGAANAEAISGVSNGEIGFFTPGNESLTTALLTNITERLVNVTNVVGIELLNEPDNQAELWSWYNATLDTLRTVPGAASFPLYVQDAFDLNAASQLVSERQDFAVVDSHKYYVYTDGDVAESAANHTLDIVGPVSTHLQANTSQSRGNLVVGEWSCALAPQSLASVSKPQEAEREFCQAEYNVFGNSSAGTIYWAWTMENCEDNAGWCFQAAAKEYLTSPLNLWDISNATYGQINNLNGTGQVELASTIAKNLSSLAIPTMPGGSLPGSGSSSGSGSGSGSVSISSPGSVSLSSSRPGHWASSSSVHHHSSSSARASHSSIPTSSSHHGTSKSHGASHSSKSSSGLSSSDSSSSSSSSSHANHSSSHSSSHSHPSPSAHASSSSSSSSNHPSQSYHSHPTSSPASFSPQPTSAAVPSHSASTSHSHAPSKSVVTIEWSQPVTITTSLEISGQVTLTLPPGRSTSTAATTPSSAVAPSNSHSAHHDHHVSSSSAPSHSAHASSASKSASSAASSSTPAVEVPGWIVGRNLGMHGGSPAARAAAAARQARHAEELAKRQPMINERHAVAAVVLNVKNPNGRAHQKVGNHAIQVASIGYSDGFVSAKVFASENLGRIGFAGQYILDSWISRLQSGELERNDQGTYSKAFQQGLDDAHTQITDLIEAAAAAAM